MYITKQSGYQNESPKKNKPKSRASDRKAQASVKYNTHYIAIETEKKLINIKFNSIEN